MRVPPKGLKNQLSGIISFLSENGKNSTAALSQQKSLSAAVAKLLNDWKNLPECERESYMKSSIAEDINTELKLKADEENEK